MCLPYYDTRSAYLITTSWLEVPTLLWHTLVPTLLWYPDIKCLPYYRSPFNPISTEGEGVTVVEKTGIYRCKTTFFIRAWQKVKVMSRPWASRSTLPLIRPFKWGTLCLRAPSGSRNTSRRSWTNKKASLLVLKQTFFQLFNFDDWYL